MLNRFLLILALTLATVAGAAFGAVDAPSASASDEVNSLRQAIWRSFETVRAEQAKLPASNQASGPALLELQLSARRPVIEKLKALAASKPQTAEALEALGLVVAWGDPPDARQALQSLLDQHSKNPETATILQTAYGESLAPEKHGLLVELLKREPCKAVAGSALYLLAQDDLGLKAPGKSVINRALALRRLHRVVSDYADAPSVLFGSGSPPTLGRAAEALMFKTERLKIGATVPPIHVHDLKGRNVSSAAFKGHVTLIDLWATWCPPCVASIPELGRLAQRYGPGGLKIVSISADADPTTVKHFLEHTPMPSLQWRVGPSGKLSAEWSNGSYPFYVLVGTNGRIIAIGDTLASVEQALPGS